MRSRALNVAAVLSVAFCLGLVATSLAARRRPYAGTFVWSGRQWDLRITAGGWVMSDTPQVLADLKAYQTATALYQTERQRLDFMTWYVRNSRTDTPEVAAFIELRDRVAAEDARISALSSILRSPEVHVGRFSWLFAIACLPSVMWGLSMWWRGRVARGRAMIGHCRWCGYDVRETPYRCPECGKSVSMWAN